MRELNIVNKKEKILIDDEDYDKYSKYRWYLEPKNVTVYRYCTIKNQKLHNLPRFIKLSRQLLNLIKDTTKVVDHINGDRLDHRRENLRLASYKENGRNRNKISNKTSSKYKGVCFNKVSKMWHCEAIIRGTFRKIYRFHTEREAAVKYNELAIIKFGEFAKLNIIKE